MLNDLMLMLGKAWKGEEGAGEGREVVCQGFNSLSDRITGQGLSILSDKLKGQGLHNLSDNIQGQG
eukprot:3641124-Heterocapsa_arctica.AAC.1